MPRDIGSAVRVGATVLVGILVLAVAIFLVGERQFLFSRKNRYFIEFENVSNLTVGNPVQLNGVTVGKVEDIVLPEDTDATVQVWITVDRRYEQRIRQDSQARIQTLGLLGDKYIAINSGSPGVPAIEPGGQIAAAPATEIDELLASGGDVVDNLVVAANSLSNILSRMERGEGLLGALVADRGDGKTINDTVTTILTDVRDVLADVKQGKGSLGRLLYDDSLARDLETAVSQLEELAAKLNEGDGLLPALVSDPALKDRFGDALENLETTSGELETMVTDLNAGDGLLPRLMKDEALADELETELRGLLEELNEADREAQPRRGHRGQAAQRPGRLRRDQRYPGRDQRVAHAPLVDPQPAEGGHPRALRRRPGRPTRTPTAPHRTEHPAMKICVVGTGYVGLVTGACLADFGMEVIGVDKDEAKIGALRSGRIPIYEPGLEDLVKKNELEGRLSFSTDLPAAIQQSAAVFIAVGTPPLPDGSTDLSFVRQVANSIARQPERLQGDRHQEHGADRHRPDDREHRARGHRRQRPSSPWSPTPSSCARARRSRTSCAPTAW